MLPGMAGTLAGARTPQTLMQDLTMLGYGANVRLSLDAGDVASWPGSGTKWKDTSGNGYDFFLGTDGSTDAPTFHGTAGTLSDEEYWSLTANYQLFTYDSINEAWMNDLHKDGAVYTIFGRVYLPSSNPVGVLLTTYSGASGGISLSISTSTLLIVYNSSGSILSKSSGGTPLTNKWNFFAASVNEPTGAGVVMLNTTNSTFTSTYTSPGTGAGTTMTASAPASIGLHTNARYGSLCVLNTALTVDQLTQLREATKWRYGV